MNAALLAEEIQDRMNIQTPVTSKVVRSARRPSLTDDQLLDVALRLFLEQGVERTNVESVTAAAGMAKRTFYQRFGSKEAVLNAAVLRGVEQWIVPTERLAAAATGDLQTSLEAIGLVLIENVLSPEWKGLLRLAHSLSGEALHRVTQALLKGQVTTREFIADLLIQHLGAQDRPRQFFAQTATLFLHFILGTSANSSAWGFDVDASEVRRSLQLSVGIFVRGIAN